MKQYQFLKLVAATTVACGISLSAYADMMEVIELQNIEPVVIDGIQPVQQSSAYVSKLALRVAPTQMSYKVNEPIRFTVNTSDNAYIYILSNDPSGKTLLVYPNKIDTNNYVRANSNQVVPSANATRSILFADRAGQETFTIIASRNPLNITDIFNVLNTGYMSASTNDVAAVLEQYGIRLGEDIEYSNTNPNISVQTLHLNISSDAVKVEQPETLGAFKTPSIAATTKYGSTLMLSIDKDSYRTNELLTATYAATGRNYINLGIRLTDGSFKIVKTYRNNNRLNQVRFAVPANINNVMLWESERNNRQSIPSADASVLLDLNAY